MREQILGAPVHENPTSIWHVELHPSREFILKSSHASPVSIKPLLQMRVQMLGAPVHVKPASIWQEELHPFPDEIPPSSHCSSVFIIEFPHKLVHTDGSLLQANPASIEHVVHPSKLTEFKSSHCSLPFIRPSPQIGVQG